MTSPKTKNCTLIYPNRHADNRGFFSETYNKNQYKEQGIEVEFVQDNHSISNVAGTLRGLHFQGLPHAQAKLVRCGQGALFDVAVDIRIGSPTYGCWEGYELSSENGHQLYIPVGFAHGFVSLVPNTEIIYKCSDYYASTTEASILWCDPLIKIAWPIAGNPILSSKDALAPLLADVESPFIFGVNS